MSARLALVSLAAGFALVIGHCDVTCGQLGGFIVPDDTPLGAGRTKLAPHGVKLPKSNLAPVPAELIRPIGVPAKDQPIVEKLQSRRLSLDVREVPLGQIIEHVRDQAGCNILLDRPALEDEGITSDTPFTATLMDAPLGQGLSRLLDPYNLTYVVKHGVLMVTSKVSADNEMIIQIYPVADLVWTGDTANTKSIDFDTLTALVEQTIAPNTWSVAGGAGSIQQFFGNLSLAISQTQPVHQQVTDLLDALRQSRGKPDQPAQPNRVTDEPKPPSQPAVVGVKDRETELRRVMRELLVSLSFDEVPLAEALKSLAERSKLTFELNRPALEDEGINEETPVTIRAGNVGLDDALYLMLGQYNLTWLIKNDVIVITSKTIADNELRTLCYPVGDLVALSDVNGRWSVYHCELQELIQQAVSPNSWSSVGGAGAIEYFAASQCLAVAQTQAVHEQIAELLRMMRESSDRFPAILRAAGMPSLDRLTEAWLKQARAESQRASERSLAAEKRAAGETERQIEEAADPDVARRRAELRLIRAQIRQAEAAATKAETELGHLPTSPAVLRDTTQSIGAAVCPHCNKPIRE